MRYAWAFLFLLLLFGCGYFKPSPYDEIRNLNRGGCGFFAYHIYLHDTLRYQIVDLGSQEHILLYDKEKLQWIDSHGYHNNLVGTRIIYFAHGPKTISAAILRKMLNDTTIWNRSFDRKDTVRLYELIDSLYIMPQ